MINRLFIAIMIILIGIGLFLEQMNFWNFGYLLSIWWPIAIVILGVINISKSKGSIFPGVIIIVVGLLLLGNQMDLLAGGFWSAFWPLILVAFGFWLIFGRKNFHLKRDVNTQNFPKFNTAFSASKHRVESSDFQGAEIVTIFGGTEIDLRRSIMSPNGAVIDINVSFGGATVFIPENWKIISSGAPIFAGFENKTKRNTFSDDDPVLTVRYFVMFGGIEFKN